MLITLRLVSGNARFNERRADANLHTYVTDAIKSSEIYGTVITKIKYTAVHVRSFYRMDCYWLVSLPHMSWYQALLVLMTDKMSEGSGRACAFAQSCQGLAAHYHKAWGGWRHRPNKILDMYVRCVSYNVEWMQIFAGLCRRCDQIVWDILYGHYKNQILYRTCKWTVIYSFSNQSRVRQGGHCYACALSWTQLGPEHKINIHGAPFELVSGPTDVINEGSGEYAHLCNLARVSLAH